MEIGRDKLTSACVRSCWVRSAMMAPSLACMIDCAIASDGDVRGRGALVIERLVAELVALVELIAWRSSSIMCCAWRSANPCAFHGVTTALIRPLRDACTQVTCRAASAHWAAVVHSTAPSVTSAPMWPIGRRCEECAWCSTTRVPPSRRIFAPCSATNAVGSVGIPLPRQVREFGQISEGAAPRKRSVQAHLLRTRGGLGGGPVLTTRWTRITRSVSSRLNECSAEGLC